MTELFSDIHNYPHYDSEMRQLSYLYVNVLSIISTIINKRVTLFYIVDSYQKNVLLCRVVFEQYLQKFFGNIIFINIHIIIHHLLQ